MIDNLKRWFYKSFVQKYFIEAIQEARDKGLRYAKTDRDEEVSRLKSQMNEFHRNWYLSSEDVVSVDKSGTIILLGGEKITEAELKNLRAEVKTLKNFRIWKIFQETLRQKAIEKAVLNSTDREQTLAGKMMIHDIGVMKSIVALFDS